MPDYSCDAQEAWLDLADLGRKRHAELDDYKRNKKTGGQAPRSVGEVLNAASRMPHPDVMRRLHGQVAPKPQIAQFRVDAGMWYGAVTSDESGVLLRIFQTLWWGGLFVKRANGWQPWSSTGAPIASVLSHGGRIILQLPKSPSGDAFWEWLTAGNKPGWRAASSHSLSLLDKAQYEQLPGNREKVWLEHKGVKRGLKNTFKQFSWSVALGGEGRYNWFSGNLIQANGEHGTLLCYHESPSKKEFGGMMIGCESAGGFKTAQTGARHDTGCHAKEWSGTGGLKFKDQSWHQCGPSEEYNSMVVDLIGSGWESIKTKAFDARWLGRKPPAPIPVDPRNNSYA